MLEKLGTVVTSNGNPGGRSLPSWIVSDFQQHAFLTKSHGRENHRATVRQHHPRSQQAKERRLEKFRASRKAARISYRMDMSALKDKGKLILAPYPVALKRNEKTPHQQIFIPSP